MRQLLFDASLFDSSPAAAAVDSANVSCCTQGIQTLRARGVNFSPPSHGIQAYAVRTVYSRPHPCCWLVLLTVSAWTGQAAIAPLSVFCAHADHVAHQAPWWKLLPGQPQFCPVVVSAGHYRLQFDVCICATQPVVWFQGTRPCCALCRCTLVLPYAGKRCCCKVAIAAMCDVLWYIGLLCDASVLNASAVVVQA